MKTSVINLEQGIATDILQIYRNEEEQPEYRVANLSMEDDDQLNISWGVEGNSESLWIPLDRLRNLIVGNGNHRKSASPHKDKPNNKRGRFGPRTPEQRKRHSKSMKEAWKKRRELATA